MKYPLSITCFLFIAMNLLAQDPLMELSFTGLEGDQHRQLDSIHIRNLSREGDTILYWPDTVLVLDYIVGTADQERTLPSAGVSTYPNPFVNYCHIALKLPSQGTVDISVSDILGRQSISYSNYLDQGSYLFDFYPGNEAVYLIRIIQGKTILSGKLIHSGPGHGKPGLVFRGETPVFYVPPQLKRPGGFLYEWGDRLLYAGYSNGIESGLSDIPTGSRLYYFQFASAVPCAGDTMVIYEGKTYPTVQIRSQCWLQKNLDIGVMINGLASQTNNGIIEKYCIDNDTLNCEKYGGLYQWDEMMQYAMEEGSQGICPSGWHVPTDLEWLILEASVDSLYHLSDDIWDTIGFRGYDCGLKLKSDSLWLHDGYGTNAVGFNALPGGTRGNGGFFLLFGENAPFWSSTTSTVDEVLYRVLVYNSDEVYRYSFDHYSGFAVRCLKDEN